MFGVLFAQVVGDGTGFAVADGAPIHFEDGREFAHSACGEAFVRCIDFGKRCVAFGNFDAQVAREIDYDTSCNAGQAGIRMGRDERSFFYDEDIGGIGFGNIAEDVEHDRVINACDIGLDFGEDVVDQIVVMDFGVDAHGRIAASRGGDQGDAFRGINRGFPLW